jgi:hypothetical protein
VLTREREPRIIFARSTSARLQRLLQLLAQRGVLALQAIALPAELRVFLRELVHFRSEVGQARLEIFQIPQELLLDHKPPEAALCSFVGRILATPDGALALGQSFFAFSEFRFARHEMLFELRDFLGKSRLSFRAREKISLRLLFAGGELTADDAKRSAEHDHEDHQEGDDSRM